MRVIFIPCISWFFNFLASLQFCMYIIIQSYVSLGSTYLNIVSQCLLHTA